MKLVSGMRPTGKLHLGHYLGVISEWLKFQDDSQSFFFVADWHALSTSYEDKLNLKQLSINLVKDWLASGIDPEKATLFVQSEVKQHAELFVILNMITPLGWLERNPTYKDQIEQLKNKDINSAGFLTYPVLQASDILLYDANRVPIGEDQRPHLEITREIARRFNHLFDAEILTEPKEILSETPKLLGLDGRKMSKSYNNSIYLTDSKKEIQQKLRSAKTDPQRIKLTDAGDPSVCLIFDYHKTFTKDQEKLQEIETGCKTASIGCVACKKICQASIDEILEPMRQKRETLTDSFVLDVIENGNKKAQTIAKNKIEQVNSVVFNKNTKS
jgi:tryptophanyl-tRNA synthetase